MFFSKSTNGFYSSEIHGDNIPVDAVEITDEQHAELMAGQSVGKMIALDGNGRPVLKDRPEPTQVQRKNKEIKDRTDQYKRDIQYLQYNWLSASISDGDSESAKKQQIQLDLAELKSDYDADISNIKSKYAN